MFLSTICAASSEMDSVSIRTALLAAGGCISLSSGSVRIDTLSIEEEAAQIVDKDVYSLTGSASRSSKLARPQA